MTQSLIAIKCDGVISIIGFLAGSSKDQPSFLECLTNNCVVRGVFVGSRLQLQEMNKAIDANKIKPVVDEKVFKLEELKEAYQYMVSSTCQSRFPYEHTNSCFSGTRNILESLRSASTRVYTITLYTANWLSAQFTSPFATLHCNGLIRYPYGI